MSDLSTGACLAYLEARSKKDESSGCWNWALRLDRDGYGMCHQVERVNGKPRRRTKSAHRVAWTAANGLIPDGMCVLHRCDNRRCCNPAHLFLGTHLDNMRDRDNKGRQAKGSRQWKAKLTEGDVSVIKTSLSQGAHPRRLASMYGVSEQTIVYIGSGHTWKHVAPARGTP